MPAYRDIADTLRADILAGRLPPGSRVPGERQLMAQHGVAKETARRALTVLTAEGLIEARQGAGTYVRSFRPILRRANQRLAEPARGRSMWDAELEGRPLHSDGLRVEECPCPEHVAGLLGLEPGTPVWMRDRRYVVEDEPVMLSTSWLPADIVRGSAITRPDTGPGGTYARLVELGYGPARFVERVRSRMPLPEESDALQLGPGMPVLLITRRAYAGSGRMVEVNEMVLSAARYECEWEIEAQ